MAKIISLAGFGAGGGAAASYVKSTFVMPAAWTGPMTWEAAIKKVISTGGWMDEWSNRSNNTPGARRAPSAEELADFIAGPAWISAGAAMNTQGRLLVTGQAAGLPTPVLIRAAAWRWGLDEDYQFARCMQESTANQTAWGDCLVDTSWTQYNVTPAQALAPECDPDPLSHFRSPGLLQVTPLFYSQGSPALPTLSTAMNLDIDGALMRTRCNGLDTGITGTATDGGLTYAQSVAQDPGVRGLRGCIMVHFTGPGSWYGASGLAYLALVDEELEDRRWEGASIA